MGVKHLADKQCSKIKVVGLVMTSQKFPFAGMNRLFQSDFGELCVEIDRTSEIPTNAYLEECLTGGVFDERAWK